MKRFLAVGFAVLTLALSVIILDAPAKISRPIFSVGNTIIESLTKLKTSFFEAYDPAQSPDVSLVGISNHHTTVGTAHALPRSGVSATQPAAAPKVPGATLSASEATQIQALIKQTFQSYIAAGKLIGLQGPQGLAGHAGIQGVQGPQGLPGSTYTYGGGGNGGGGTIGGFTELSAVDLNVSNNSNLNNLTVSGSLNAKSLALTNALSVSSGGTGANTFTPNGILFGNDTSAIGTTSAGTTGQCLQSNGSASAPSWGACTPANGSAWSSLTNPLANLALSMQGFTTALTYSNATGAGANLFTLTDTASNTGTGYLLNVTTASGSTLKPLQVVSAGATALTIDSTGLVTANNLAATALTVTGNHIALGSTGPSSSEYIGFNAAPSATGISNAAVGYYAGHALTSAVQATAFGSEALELNSTGNYNTAVGAFASQLDTTGMLNTAVGAAALQKTTTGSYNTALGSMALQNNNGSHSYNTAVGANTLIFATADNNTGVGMQVMQFDQTGGYNSGFGTHALYQNLTGHHNVGLGEASLYSDLTGNYNIGIGYLADYYQTMSVGTLSLSNGSANLGVGVYIYKVAFVLNGSTTTLSMNLGDTITTTSGHQEVTITSIPTYTGPLTCTARIIYRTKVGATGGDQLFYRVAIINDNITTTFVDAVPDSSLTVQPTDPSGSILMGYMPNVTDRTAYKSSQFVVGSDSQPITEFWAGRGVYSATPSDILMSATGGSGNNVAGANLVMQGGPGTGNAASGAVIFKAASAGSSGSAWNAPTEVARITSSGLGIGTTTPSEALYVVGNIYATGNITCGGTCGGGGGSSQWTTSGNNIYYNTGNVGIGASSPTGKLTLGGNVSAIAWGLNGIALQGSAAIYTDTSSSGTVANAVANSIGIPTFAASSATTYTSASTLYVAGPPTAGTNVIITNPAALVVATGNVGIGTTTPQGLLDVSGSSSSTDLTTFVGSRSISIINTDQTNNNASGFAFRTLDANGLLTSGAKFDAVYTSHTANAVSADIVLLTRNAGTISEKLRVTAAGNVGIGATTPSGKLTLAGNSSASAWGLNGIALQGAAATYTDTSSSGTVTNNVANSFGQPTLAASSATTYTNAATIYLAGPPIAGSNVTITNPASLVVASGNVGIGTASPTHPLHVVYASPGGSAATIVSYSQASDALGGSGTITSLRGDVSLSGTTAQSGDVYGGWGYVTGTQTASVTGNMIGLFGESQPNASSGTYSNSIGLKGLSSATNGGGSVTHSIGVYGQTNTGNAKGIVSIAEAGYFQNTVAASGSLATGYGVYIDTPVASGTYTTNYGLYINSQQGPVATYAFYQAGSSDKNYFAGSVGINATSPASKLDIVPTGTFAAAGISGISSEAHTVTLSGADPTTYPTFYANSLGVMTLTGSNSNQTVTTASSLYVATPVAGTNVTVTNNYPISTQTGAYLSSGGTWTNASDRNLKENFTPVDPADILNKINTLPVTEWDYKTEGPTVKHIGPVAQDFYSVFALGNNNTSISTIDPAGVALLGIQALSKQLQNIQGSINGNVNTSGSLTISGPETLQSTLTVLKQVTFSGDTVGEAEIKAGATSVRISFSEQYQYQPIVTITPTSPYTSRYWVDHKDASGFTIELDQPETLDLTFDWYAVGAEGAKLTVSDGTSQDITLVLPPSASTADTSSSESGSVNAEPASGSGQSSTSSSVSNANGNQTDSAGAASPVSSPDTTTPSNLGSGSITTSKQSGTTSSSGTGNAAQPVPADPITTSEVDTPTSSATAASPQGQAVNAVQ
jgi:Chaperone of endosialidase